MPELFDISTPTNSIRLDERREANASFTVANLSGRLLNGRAQIAVDKPESAPWISIEGEAERPYAIAGSQQYTVRVSVPRDAPPGSYTFRLDVLDVANPDETLRQGPGVAFEVPEPEPEKKPFPIGIPILIIVLILIVVGGILIATRQPEPEPTPTPTPTSTPTATPTATPTITPTPPTAGITLTSRSLSCSGFSATGIGFPASGFAALRIYTNSIGGGTRLIESFENTTAPRVYAQIASNGEFGVSINFPEQPTGTRIVARVYRAPQAQVGSWDGAAFVDHEVGQCGRFIIATLRLSDIIVVPQRFSPDSIISPFITRRAP